MEYWTSDASGAGIAVDSVDVCHLLNALGSVDHTALATSILNLTSQHSALAECAVLSFVGDLNPTIVSVASRSNQRQILHCASNYARNLHRHDRIQLHLQSILPHQEIGQTTVHRQTLTQIIDVELRRLYHDTLEVVDTLAITIKTGPREWITTNLCRHKSQGLFKKDEIECIRQLAPLIAASVSRHCRLEAASEGDLRTSVNDGIDQLCSKLTQRERQVILRILDGVTVEQISNELGLKPTTVITYRSRAYDKLGIRSRSELFSAVLGKRHSGCELDHLAITGTHSPIYTHTLYATGTGTDRPHQ